MSSPKVLFGFHAVGVRLKTAPKSIVEIYFEPTRRDARMRQFIERVKESGVRLIEADGMRLSKLCGSHGHQGVAARVEAVAQVTSLDELLEQVEARGESPLLLVLDGITDPHNLGACLRVADGAGAHAVIAPKDHAAGINATVAKVASGASETMPYFMVTNLARTLMATPDLIPLCEAAFAGQPVIEKPLAADVSKALGEYRLVAEDGYPTSAGVWGANAKFHTPIDGADSTTAEIMEPIARAIASVIEARLSAL